MCSNGHEREDKVIQLARDTVRVEEAVVGLMPKSGVGRHDAEIANWSILPPEAQVADSYIQDDSAYIRGVKQDIDQERLTKCQDGR